MQGVIPILDFTGIDTKFSNQRTPNGKEKLYIKRYREALEVAWRSKTPGFTLAGHES